MNKNWLTPLLLCTLAGCQSFQEPPPYNICEANPGVYPANYSFMPEELDPLVRIAPNYPRAAQEDKIEGYVKLSYTVVDGGVKDIEIIESSPQGTFDYKAKEALKRWRYRKTYKDCVVFPHEYKMQTHMDFNL